MSIKLEEAEEQVIKPEVSKPKEEIVGKPKEEIVTKPKQEKVRKSKKQEIVIIL